MERNNLKGKNKSTEILVNGRFDNIDSAVIISSHLTTLRSLACSADDDS